MDSSTTFLAISDVHGRFEVFPAEALPDADAVLIAGDMTDMGMRGRELAHCGRWLSALAARYPAVFWIPGNHDIGVRPAYFEGIAPNLHCLLDRTMEWEGWSLHGVSLSPCYDMPELAQFWDYMTADPRQEAAAFDFEPVDIVLSHGPPYGHRDSAGRAMVRTEREAIEWREVRIGSRELEAYIGRCQPRLVVCGHAHNNPVVPLQSGATWIHNVAERWETIRLARFSSPAHPST
jgi:Icc-related predicted phosphoesterase